MIIPAHDLVPTIHDALKRGQSVRMTVTGSSMVPFIHNNDVVELLTPPKKLRQGDIVLSQISELGADARYVLHRIVRIESGLIFIRGDAQPISEGPFALESVLGRVTTTWHNGCVRTLHQGRWRLAGLLWMYSMPLSFQLLRSIMSVKGIVGRVLRWLQ